MSDRANEQCDMSDRANEQRDMRVTNSDYLLMVIGTL